ncbi:hypothetical protein CYMTET_10420 [Cymbomonas tetramitiformis]|uniref:Glycosyl transferase family 28 C-terminal domain-containing protein n=1 Tax=Cymbomonas tetramitiformis TaxID=36881 RepID=A0AAE0GPD9_9CHLO|nr:hypothetical protein CYMTET_10420 [Cymbomonas tetramitiformis]
MKARTSGTVFVTVGTTSFDDLISVVDSPCCIEALREKGFDKIVIQLGRGTYVPKLLGKDQKERNANGINSEYFAFSSSLAENIKSADLVISHAGSGSIFETLGAGRPLIVVVNDKLMDNHQQELADELTREKYLVSATPVSLVKAIQTLDVSKLLPYTPGEPSDLVRGINDVMGVPSKSV